MRYFKVAWRSDDPADPRLLFYEVSDDDRVTRRMEIYEDGRADCDDVSRHSREELGRLDSLVEGAFIASLPPPDDPLFTWAEVVRAEFEAEWTKRGCR